MQAVVRSTSHNHAQVLDRRDHSAFMLAARSTLPHFSFLGDEPAESRQASGDLRPFALRQRATGGVT
jgi:hypothetical protein